jgi:signal transduction histidine kinase
MEAGKLGPQARVRPRAYSRECELVAALGPRTGVPQMRAKVREAMLVRVIANPQWSSGELRLVQPSSRLEPAPCSACGSHRPAPMLRDAEVHLVAVADVVDLALADRESRVALAASRARIVAAADESRRRIERDLHDGVQQRLVSLLVKLHGLTQSLPAGQRELADAIDELEQAVEELRDVARGIHPAILTERGLNPALRALARRAALPVDLVLPADRRFPEQVEVTAYYVACEALTNAVKHGKASCVRIQVEYGMGVLTLSIRDDGVGGAHSSRGSGLNGLADRVEAARGTMSIDSPSGRGTAICVRLPSA